ncbi:hypothetical protein [Nocardia tengchongensis]|uniref:hypothetical protein n=1 Tax=Nocardia tengchongensis TaxID=2055889 RepID=UPI0036198ECF
MITAIFVAVWALAIAALPPLIRLACSESETEPSNLVRPTVYAWIREQQPAPVLRPQWHLAGAWPL